MTRLLTIFISAFCLLPSAFGQVAFSWNASPSVTNTDTFCYIVFHGTAPRSYADAQSVGKATACFWTNALPDGTNYFTVAILGLLDGELQMSDWSNEAQIVKVSGTELQSVVLTCTNLDGSGAWTPWVTNRFALHMNEPRRFFRNGGVAIVQTNALIFPPLPSSP